MQPSRSLPKPLRNSIAILLVALACPRSDAAVFTWDSDLVTAGAQDGGGTWNTIRPPHSPTPIPVLTVPGAAGAKAIS